MSTLSLSRDVAWFDRRCSLVDLPILSTDGERLALSEQRATIFAPLERVFAEYVTAPPAEVWPADRIAFRFGIAPGSRQRIGPEDPWPGLEVGTRIFADLSVLPPSMRLRIMVGVVVTKIEPQFEIRYDYLEGAVTRGWNSMRFRALSGGRTRVDHISFYRGTAPLHRALMPVLQPILHDGFVDALHENMKERIEGGGAR